MVASAIIFLSFFFHERNRQCPPRQLPLRPPQSTETFLPTGTWKVDPVHSSVEFQVKHLGIATVKGQFNEFEGTLEVGPDGAAPTGQ